MTGDALGPRGRVVELPPVRTFVAVAALGAFASRIAGAVFLAFGVAVDAVRLVVGCVQGKTRTCVVLGCEFAARIGEALVLCHVAHDAARPWLDGGERSDSVDDPGAVG